MVSPLQNQNYGQKESSREKVSSPGLLKKSELSLRVNCTSDVGSQTEKGKACETGGSVRSTSSSCSSSFDDSSSGKSEGAFGSAISSYTGRQKSQEELECEELSRVLIQKLPQGDKLQQILGKFLYSKNLNL